LIDLAKQSLYFRGVSYVIDYVTKHHIVTCDLLIDQSSHYTTR